MKPSILTIIAVLCFVASPEISADESLQMASGTKVELVGIWWPDEQAKAEITKRAPGRAMLELELRGDGNFALVNIPKWWRNVFGQPSGKLGGVSGQWTLKENASSREILLEAFGLSMTLGVTDDASHPEILVHVGDGERSLAVRFKKRPN